jgi:hypothetical protein
MYEFTIYLYFYFVQRSIMRLQIVNQTVKKYKGRGKKVATKLNVPISQIPANAKTTVIISKRNLARIKAIGRYGESLDDIVNKIIDFDINLTNSQYVNDS